MLLFPLTWLLAAGLAAKLAGWPAAVIAVIIVPACGYVAVRFFEEIDQFSGSLAALSMFLMRRRFFVKLLAERAAIRREILALGEDARESIS